MIYALYISCIFAPFSTLIQCANPTGVCACMCVRVLQDCSRERFDGRSRLKLEQFSQHKIQKSAALKNKISPKSPTGPLISSENTLAAKDFDFKGRRRDLLALFLCLQLSARQT